MFSEVGKELSSVPASQQARISTNWGVTTVHNTGKDLLTDATELSKLRISRQFRRLRDETDVRGASFTTDNVGSGSKKRYELTTLHSKILAKSDLPGTVQGQIRDPSADHWTPMVKSGNVAPSDLAATDTAEDVLRLTVVMLFKDADASLPDALPDNIGQPPTRATSMSYNACKDIVQFDYHAMPVEDSVVPFKTMRAPRSMGGGKPNPSIWERGHSIHPQVTNPSYTNIFLLLTDSKSRTCAHLRTHE